MKLTKLQQELLLDRLAVSECIAEVIAQTRVIDGLSAEEVESMPDYDERSIQIRELIHQKCSHLESCVRAGYLPALVTMDRDYADIVEDICDGSTFFASEDDSRAGWRAYGQAAGDGDKSPAWWNRRHAAADDLEKKLAELLGKKIIFARE